MPEPSPDFHKTLIAVPDRENDWPKFLAQLSEWRDATLKGIEYNSALYERTDLQWMNSAFSCGLVMIFDQEFFDAEQGEYQLESYLERIQHDFGGFDALVLWHAYPRIGVDDRNQFDFYRQSPGGLERLRNVVDRLHDAGVKVFIDYNPWDTGTRRDSKDDLAALVDLVRDLDVDGIFLDTMEVGAPAFREVLDATRPGVVLEPEGMTPVEGLPYQHASWGQGFDYCWPKVHGRPARPGILRNKYLEPRHMIHQTFRWAIDHTDELHTAWLNGSGMMIWENVFGSWFAWSEWDKCRWRSCVTILRRYCGLFTSRNWVPLYLASKDGIGVSHWFDETTRIWTVCSRLEHEYKGAWFAVEPRAGSVFIELVSGRFLELLDGRVEGLLRPGDVAAVLELPADAIDEDLLQFLQRQRELYARWNRDTDISPLPVTRVVRSRKPCPPAPDAIPVPAASQLLEITYRERECGFYERIYSDQVDNPWTLGMHHSVSIHRHFETPGYTIASREVTNAEYLEFLRATGYLPRLTTNFLAHWHDGAPKQGCEEDPVVWIDLIDASAYCDWKGARLPDEFEWQYAAELGLLARLTPPVWNWTESVHTDGHTNFCILKGGSFYQAEGSEWYTDGGVREPSFSLKFILHWPGLDRCSTVGFRCAYDRR